jgi:hypothetical protein
MRDTILSILSQRIMCGLALFITVPLQVYDDSFPHISWKVGQKW